MISALFFTEKAAAQPIHSCGQLGQFTFAHAVSSGNVTEREWDAGFYLHHISVVCF
jgi:hypothetical protein